jgi:deoxyribonuclease V
VVTAPFPDLPDLPALLRALVAQVPPGRVTTCGTLAAALGNPIAARWVGHFLLHHEHDAACPCHRVVLAGGLLGNYVAGLGAAKARRLGREGVPVRCGVVDLERYGWSEFESDRPLERLKQVQASVLARAVIRRRRKLPRLVGGVDLAYRGPVAAAAFALVDAQSGELVWSSTRVGQVRFPYITSYLSFRELPLLLELIEEVRHAGRLPDVVLVDGSGMLHPRQAGIATHLGVVAQLSTVGVTKKLLCGRVQTRDLDPGQSCPVVLDDRVVGVALRPTSGSRRPIYISIGNAVDLNFAEHLVRSLLVSRRLPGPIYWADRLSRQTARQANAIATD